MKYQKLNREEKRELNKEILGNVLHGEGIYVYRNNTKGDLTLPRPTKSGIRSVEAGKEFQGDNYYMQLVRDGFLRLVKEIQSPEQQRESLKEEKMEEKLILDQPDIVTDEGKVEHVIKKKTGLEKYREEKKRQKLLAQEQAAQEEQILLNE